MGMKKTCIEINGPESASCTYGDRELPYLKFGFVSSDQKRLKRRLDEFLAFTRSRSRAIIWRKRPSFDRPGPLHRVVFRAAFYPPPAQDEWKRILEDRKPSSHEGEGVGALWRAD